MRRPRRLPVGALALALSVVASCSAKEPEQPAEAEHAPVAMQLLAVLPIEPAPPPNDKGSAPPDEAGLAVTAQLYRVLADQTEFRFIPDLSVSDVLATPALRRADSVKERAEALGKDVGADGVIFGRVFRYDKRVGTERGASQPASVSFELDLVRVSNGEVVWTGHFDETQGPLGSSLFSWLTFWRDGPRWFSASELAGLGVDKLFEDLTESVNAEG